jgi:HPt (histidine-containing phosphotransfer) domain-containing protein
MRNHDMAQTELLDRQVLLRMAERADAGFVRQLVKLVMAEMNQRLVRIAAAEADHDYANLRQASHSIAGSAATVGARRLGALAREIEHGADCADTAIWTRLPELQAVGEATLAAFASLLDDQVKNSD